MKSSYLASCIDHTLLKPEAGQRDIGKLCREAGDYKFAAVCVNPIHVKTARSELDRLDCQEIRVCSVIGFPLGACTTAVKAFETEQAVADGAAEVDMVINIGALKEGDQAFVLADIGAVVQAARGRVVKVIVETGLLTEEEKVLACSLAQEAGAHFVKTSTGFGPGGATVSDIRLMKETVGVKMEVKASGGVRTLAEAMAMLKAGATRIGTSRGGALMEELSAQEG
jgi:deoxyribose-phosphate aldolase